MLTLGMLGLISDTATYEHITTIRVTSTVSTITFSNVAALAAQGRYNHFELRILGRNANANAFGIAQVRVNTDATSSYRVSRLRAGSTNVAGVTSLSSVIDLETSFYINISGAANDTGVFSPGIVTFLNIATPGIIPSSLSLSSRATNDNWETLYRQGAYVGSETLSSLTVNSTAGLVAGSSYSLYGIRG